MSEDQLTASILTLGYGGYLLWRAARVTVGYKTKMLCSGVFISKRTPESILGNDLSEGLPAPLQLIIDRIKTEVTKQATTGNLWGLVTRKAVFRPGLGCTLLVGLSEEQLPIDAIAISTVKPKELPKVDRLPPEIDEPKLNLAQYICDKNCLFNFCIPES